jgi:hypothetical protein
LGEYADVESGGLDILTVRVYWTYLVDDVNLVNREFGHLLRVVVFCLGWLIQGADNGCLCEIAVDDSGNDGLGVSRDSSYAR